jgi:tetratricopeptide (TPR) repeat protein
MTKSYRLIALAAVFFFSSSSLFAQNYAALQQGAMTMTTKSKQAKQFTAMGLFHLMNVEREAAYNELLQAEKADPKLTIALVLLSNLSNGAMKKEFAKKAMESATNKTESEKLVASLVDEKSTPEIRRETWAKLKSLNPNDPVIGHFYVTSRTADDRLAAALEYNEKYPEQAAMYNLIGYYYMLDKKDYGKAKTYFEKYIQLYPEGYNPYDSMGEYYLTTGDMENAEKYYNMSLEKFPFNSSSLTALSKIADQKKAKQ